MNPSKEQALQFATILSSGIPGREAILYFLPEDSGETIDPNRMLEAWMRSKVVQKAIDTLQGRSWQDMTLDERLRLVRDKVYTEMAFYLYSNNYSELTGANKSKADTCRIAIEQKLAGTAGQLDPVERFMNDILAGRVRLGGQAQPYTQE